MRHVVALREAASIAWKRAGLRAAGVRPGPRPSFAGRAGRARPAPAPGAGSPGRGRLPGMWGSTGTRADARLAAYV